jgi:cyclohexadienyl dehydratase
MHQYTRARNPGIGMKHLAWICGLGLVLMTGVTPTAQAQLAPSAPVAMQVTRLDEIVARGTLRIGMTGDYKPFTFFNPEKNAFEGMDVDMGESLAKALGVKAEFVKTSWPTLVKDFDAGLFDIGMGGISITFDRARKGFFSTAIMREGKTPITRCENKDKFATIADIDKAGVRAIVNPGGTNERFAKANLKAAEIKVHPDNVTIFDEIVKGNADLMITDASETIYQAKLKPELCAVHPEKPFDFFEKAYWMPRDVVLKSFVDQWLHITRETGAFQRTYDAWFK